MAAVASAKADAYHKQAQSSATAGKPFCDMLVRYALCVHSEK